MTRLELKISPRVLMLEKRLTGLEVRLEGLADKLEFVQEDTVVQLQEMRDDLQKARVVMDATKAGWKKTKGSKK